MGYQQPTPFALFEDIRPIDETADINARLRFGYRVRDTSRPRHITFDANVGAVRLRNLKVRQEVKLRFPIFLDCVPASINASVSRIDQHHVGVMRPKQFHF